MDGLVRGIDLGIATILVLVVVGVVAAMTAIVLFQ